MRNLPNLERILSKRLLTTSALIAALAPGMLGCRTGINTQSQVITPSSTTSPHRSGEGSGYLNKTPLLGERIEILYRAGEKNAAIRAPEGLRAEVLLLRHPPRKPSLIEIPMSISRGEWRGTFRLSDPAAKVMYLRFVSGTVVDDRKGNCWEQLVYDRKGKPVEGAWMLSAMMSLDGGMPEAEFRIAKDVQEAETKLGRELKLYPDNWWAHDALWSLWREKDPGAGSAARIRPELDRICTRFQDGRPVKDEGEFATFASWYGILGDKERAAALRQETLATYPKGRSSLILRREDIRKMRGSHSDEEIAQAHETLLSDFADDKDNADRIEMVYASLMQTRLSLQQYDKAMAAAKSMKAVSGMMWLAIAQRILKDKQYEEAIKWADEALQLFRNPPVEKKPPYRSTSSWIAEQQGLSGRALDTIAVALSALGRNEEAVTKAEEAYLATKGSVADINEHFAGLLIASSRYERALEIAARSIEEGAANDAMFASYRTAHLRLNGDGAAAEVALGKLRDHSLSRLETEVLSTRINMSAPSLELNTPDGAVTRLADYRGKVVVMDFWASWCRPCLESFPYLQQVFQKHEKNPDVRIFAVNMWENMKGPAREKTVKDLFNSQGYTIPVLYSKNDLEDYGVEGLPTRIVIDREGVVQFRHVGFEGGQKMVDTLNAQISLLLNTGANRADK